MLRAVIGAFFVLGALFWSAPILAAPAISINSSPDTIVAGQSFNLAASASGLTVGSNYYAKVRIGSTSAAMNKGQTFNSLNDSPDDWLSDTSDWTKFPIIISDSFGIWTGSLTARPMDTVFLGLNYLTLRLRSPGGTNYDSASVSAIISPAPQTSPPPPATTISPTISITAPDKSNLGDQFKVKVELVGFDVNADYFCKLRGGFSETVLTKVQTQNGVAFLSDTEIWTKFPIIHTDQDGKWSGEVTGRFEEDKEAGAYKIRARLRKKDTETSYDSPLRDLTVTQAIIIPPPIASPSGSKQVAAAERESSPETKLVLGTQSGEVKVANPAEPPQNNKPNNTPLIMVILGAAIAATSVAIFMLKGRLGV